MEEIVKDVLNIGLGAAEKVRAVINGDRNLNITIEELKAHGAANQGETATRLRSTVENALTQLQDARGKVDTIVANGQTQLNETLSKLNVPALNVDELKANLDSYAALLQEKLNEIVEKARPMLEKANIQELRSRVEEIIAKVRGANTTTAAPKAAASSKASTSGAKA